MNTLLHENVWQPIDTFLLPWIFRFTTNGVRIAVEGDAERLAEATEHISAKPAAKSNSSG